MGLQEKAGMLNPTSVVVTKTLQWGVYNRPYFCIWPENAGAAAIRLASCRKSSIALSPLEPNNRCATSVFAWLPFGPVTASSFGQSAGNGLTQAVKLT